MPPALFLSSHPFFEDGAINGRKQANAGFMRALLAADPFDQYHFFVNDPVALEAQWGRLPQLAALRRGAARALPRGELLGALAKNAYAVCHLSDPVDDYVRMAVARNRLAPRIFALTAPNHTLSYARYAPAMLAYAWDGWTSRDALGCNSTSAREVLRRWFGVIGARQPSRLPRLTVMPMGADPRGAVDAALSRCAMREHLGLAEADVLLLLFGRLSAVDKMDPLPLLLAMRRATALVPGARLALALSGAWDGDDPSSGILSVLARGMGLAARVLPNPTDAQKDGLFAAADIFVSPSDNIQETFGLSLVEALAAGLPIIASDWDGYRDIVEPGVTGLLVPTLAPGDTPDLDLRAGFLFDNHYHYLRGQSTCVDVPALARAIAALAADADLRHRMGEAARKRAERFTWGAAVARWVAFWEYLNAAPLSPAEEARCRSAQHPFFPPFGRMFAHYASDSLRDADMLFVTENGQAFLRGSLPWEAVNCLRYGFGADEIRPMLVFARKPVSMSGLRERCALGRERFTLLLHFCLKHDLLERRVAEAPDQG